MEESLVLTPILVDTGASDNVLVQCSKGNYYYWNVDSDHVSKILAPTKVEEIIPMLGHPAHPDLKYERLKPVLEEAKILPAEEA